MKILNAIMFVLALGLLSQVSYGQNFRHGYSYGHSYRVGHGVGYGYGHGYGYRYQPRTGVYVGPRGGVAISGPRGSVFVGPRGGVSVRGPRGGVYVPPRGRVTPPRYYHGHRRPYHRPHRRW